LSEPAVEIYVYYRAPEAAAEAVLAAFARLQRALDTTPPGLEARLLRRPELVEGEQTWMEIYRCEDGVDAALEAHIEAAASAAFDGVSIGARHRERFIACVW
jgi:hypothetical protein